MRRFNLLLWAQQALAVVWHHTINWIILLYTRHLCRGVYSFRLSIRPFIRSMPVRNFVLFVELLQSFTLKQLEWSISHQPHIRKHSYLDHRYPAGSAFIPWLYTLWSLPWGGARGQKLGHLLKVFFYFSVMETTYADSWSDMAQPCDMDLWVMKWRSAWPIFHGPVILSYLQDYLMYIHHTLGVWISMTWRLTSKLM